VLRYDATGTLDPNFGDASVQGTDAQLIVSAATTLPNGGFLEAGLTDVSEQSHLFLRSISPDGTLGGALVAPALWNGGSIADCSVQPDGKILIVSTISDNQTLTLNHFEITRLNPDGSVDATYAAAGVLSVDAATQNISDEFLDAALQPDGKLAVVMERADPDKFAPGPTQVLRFNNDGTPDLTFGKNGIFTGIHSASSSIAVQSDGKLLLSTVTGDWKSVLLQRLLPSGSVDSTFGDEGGTHIPPRSNWTFGGSTVAVGPDGHIFVAMMIGGPEITASYKVGGHYDNELIGVARLSRSGTMDKSFGNGGTTWVQPFQHNETDFQPGHLIAMAIEPDGKPVIANYSGTTRLLSESESVFAVHRGKRLTIYAKSGDDQLTLNTQNGLQVTLNGQSLLFNNAPGIFGAGKGIKEIQVVWPGHPTLRHLQAPLSGTIQQIAQSAAAG